MRVLILVLGLAASTAAAADAPKAAAPAEPKVELARYMGDWYEIAHLPNFPQRGCVDTTVHYKLSEGGGFDLVNACAKGGKLKEYRGHARPWTPGAAAKFRVKFFAFIGSDYWIVDLDPDYRWAAVGTSKRDQFWVISRARTLDDETYQGILSRAKAGGYDLSRLERTVLSPGGAKGP
jgi:apolipoprotein D and lipocalin family protein